MKSVWMFFLLMAVFPLTGLGQMGVGTSSPDGSSMLDVSSTTKGLLVPRMTASQRNAISSPATGLLVFVIDDNTFYFRANSAWIPVLSTLQGDGQWITSGSNIYSGVSGNVGIGTTSPGQQLELTKSFKMPLTTSSLLGILYKGDNPFLHDFKYSINDGNNVFLGINSGNFTMGGGPSYCASSNVGVGINTLHALSLGYENTAVGANCMSSTANGYENVAMGNYALQANISGARNTSLGNFSSLSNSTGNRNTVVGWSANYYNQQGVMNTIIGVEAGRGSSLRDISGNIFIGYQAGYSENGNNKLYIENSNSTSPLIGGDFSSRQVYLNGYVGIGTTSPEARLHVSGTLRIADGSQSSGKVFVSDANGTGSWTDPATLPDKSWTISGSNMYATITGNVGIGTTSPGQQLELTGSVKLPATTNSTTGIIYKGTTPFLHNYHGSSATDMNTFIGLGSGNFTMGSGVSYQGTNNTGCGVNTLPSVTTGYENTGIGAYSLSGTTTGYENTAMGLWSMIANTGGVKNTAIGSFASKENTTGIQNVSLGMNANFYNQTGSNNTCIGYEAGKGTALHNKSGGIFIGFQAGVNETGSNKLYIDNSSTSTPLIGGDFSTDQLYLNGQVGVGTITPSASAKMEISSTTAGFLPPRLTVQQIAAISSPAAGLMVFNTTTSLPNFFDGSFWRDFTGSTAFPQLGAYYEGGTVFYIDGTGLHGFVAQPSNQDDYADWGCQGTTVGASGTAVGTGAANTNAIVANCSTSDIAARQCYNLVLNNKSDWYMPSKDEVNLMFTQRSFLSGLTGIYYTSTESDASHAWVQYFYSGSQTTIEKGLQTGLRCIRSF
jgi:trimeric autotransporter adhesin